MQDRAGRRHETHLETAVTGMPEVNTIISVCIANYNGMAVIDGCLRSVLGQKGQIPMEIWGDGENIRDFIYIEDVVEVCLRFIGLPQDSGTYNLGSGVGHSFNQVRCIVEGITGVELKASRHPARNIDVRAVILDIGRVCRELHWTPKVDLYEGVRQTWVWLRNAP